MNINPIGNGNYYIEIVGAELCESSVESLLRDGAGLSEGAVYEVFGGDGGALVFARMRRGAPSYFRFASLEAVLAAARAAGESPEQAGDSHSEPQGAAEAEPKVALAQNTECITYLAWLAERFWLIFYPWDGEPPPHALGEFAETTERAHPDFVRHMTEHGDVLLGPYALSELVRWFGE